jgi:hypothetical protein
MQSSLTQWYNDITSSVLSFCSIDLFLSCSLNVFFKLSQLLSPQVTATPQKIEAVLRSVDTSTPIVDLSWAVQSLIARKKLNFNDDERFIAGAGIYSIKVKGQEGTEVRYEKGDTVKIRRNIKGDISHARINGIHLGERMLSVEILVRWQ